MQPQMIGGQILPQTADRGMINRAWIVKQSHPLLHHALLQMSKGSTRQAPAQLWKATTQVQQNCLLSSLKGCSTMQSIKACLGRLAWRA